MESTIIALKGEGIDWPTWVAHARSHQPFQESEEKKMKNEYYDFKIKEDRWGREGQLNFTLYDGQKLIDMFKTKAEAKAKIKELENSPQK